jgi:hypothetical protein
VLFVENEMKLNICTSLEVMTNDTFVLMNINASIGLTKEDGREILEPLENFTNEEFYLMSTLNVMKLAKQYYLSIYKKMILSMKLDTSNTMAQKKPQLLKYSNQFINKLLQNDDCNWHNLHILM